jgi:hypothetical protein
MMLVLQSQIVRRQSETLDIIARLLDICLASTPPTPAIVPAINTCANFLLMRRTLDEEVWRVMEIALTRFSTVAHNRGQMSTGVFVWSEESAVLTVSLLSGNDDIPPWINRFLEDAIHRHDLPLIKSFVNRAVGGAISLGTVGPITKFLTPLLDQPEPISRLVADSIANLRMYYPNAVDDALSEIDSSGAFQRLVRDRAPVENLGELQVSHLTRFLGESVMVGATDGRIEWVRDWLASAPNCSNSREWLKSLVTDFANAIYGGRLF